MKIVLPLVPTVFPGGASGAGRLILGVDVVWTFGFPDFPYLQIELCQIYGEHYYDL